MKADRLFASVTYAAIALLVGSLLVLVVGALVLGAPAFGSELLGGGLLRAAWGTALVTSLMTLAVIPVGVATAVHLGEYARQDALYVRLVRAAVRSLASVPSVVFGLFGLGFFVLFLGRGLDAALYADTGAAVFGRPAVIWASLTLAVLTLPVVIVTTEEALRAVPRELREASHALGASKLETVRFVVLPAARSGILTGAILATSRGAGEVAAVLFTGVASWLPEPTTDLRDGFMHLGYHVYVLATQSPDVEVGRALLFACAAIFVLATASLNLLAFVLRDRARRGAT